MLDLHTHILPGMDDGSKSPGQSITMLGTEKEQGVGTVVLTPHFYADREPPERFLERRNKSAKQLKTAATGTKGLPRMFLGAEVAFFNGMSRAESIGKLCISGTNALLVEMPFDRWGQGVFEELEFLIGFRGIRPIIAHIDRYMWYQPRGTVKRLCDLGVWIQTNTSFFNSWQTSMLAMYMLKRRQIHFLGSDCHNMKTRPPDMGDALSRIDKRLGKSALSHLERMEQRLLEGV